MVETLFFRTVYLSLVHYSFYYPILDAEYLYVISSMLQEKEAVLPQVFI